MNIGRISKYVILLAALMIALPTVGAICCPPAAIGDRVWEDLNINGIQDAGEPGIAGVTVELYDCEGTPTLLASMVTDGNGLYEFTELAGDEDYCVKFILPGGWAFSPMDQGADDAIDSDANPTGMTVCTVLECGETNLTWDAGMYESDTPSPGTGTPGYWMNHPDAWPVESIDIGGVLYPKVVAIDIMKTSGKGDKTVTMFRALVSAKLNVHISNPSWCIEDAVTAADIWMATNTDGVRAKSDAWQEGGEQLYEKLDLYNNGELCALSRDMLEEAAEAAQEAAEDE